MTTPVSRTRALPSFIRESPEVVSWATVDAIVDGWGTAGLFMAKSYRQRGLATICAAAALLSSRLCRLTFIPAWAIMVPAFQTSGSNLKRGKHQIGNQTDSRFRTAAPS